MYCFRISIHVRPADTGNGPVIELGGRPVSTLKMRTGPPAPLCVSFEEASEVLARQPRMFIEPDGAFVWVSPSAASPWQVDGVLYDGRGRLMYVEAKGNCPAPEFDRLLTALGWPATELIFQLVPEAVFLDERAFGQWAAANGPR